MAHPCACRDFSKSASPQLGLQSARLNLHATVG
jgi:hypothetical protein